MVEGKSPYYYYIWPFARVNSGLCKLFLYMVETSKCYPQKIHTKDHLNTYFKYMIMSYVDIYIDI